MVIIKLSLALVICIKSINSLSRVLVFRCLFVYCRACHTQLHSDERQNSADRLLPRNQYEGVTSKMALFSSLSVTFHFSLRNLHHFHLFYHYLFKVKHLFIHDKNKTAKLMWSCLDIKNLSKRLSKRHLQRGELLITKIMR